MLRVFKSGLPALIVGLVTGVLIWQRLEPQPRKVYSITEAGGMSFFPDGKTLFLGRAGVNGHEKGPGYFLRLLDLDTGEEKTLFPDWCPTDLALSPDGHMVVGGYFDDVFLWQRTDGRKIDLPGDRGKVAFAPDGRPLFALPDQDAWIEVESLKTWNGQVLAPQHFDWHRRTDTRDGRVKLEYGPEKLDFLQNLYPKDLFWQNLLEQFFGCQPPQPRIGMCFLDSKSGTELAFVEGQSALFTPDDAMVAVRLDRTIRLYRWPRTKAWWRAVGWGLVAFFGVLSIQRLVGRIRDRAASKMSKNPNGTTAS